MSKEFKPTYLCVKTHTITGLKYFCKTTKHHYERYSGSGVYWKRHLKEHGWHFTTELLGFYSNKEECNAAAIKFSLENDIVNAVDTNGKKIWANSIIENGLDGGDTGRVFYSPTTDETKQKISIANKGKLPWNKGKNGSVPGNKLPRSESTKKLLSIANTGKKRSIEASMKTSEKLRGRKRPEVSEKLRGRKHTDEAIQNMRIAQQNKGPMPERVKQKIREKRKLQVFSTETKEKLSGRIVVIDKTGTIKKIDKDIFYSQTGSQEEREYVFHLSAEGKKRKRN